MVDSGAYMYMYIEILIQRYLCNKVRLIQLNVHKYSQIPTYRIGGHRRAVSGKICTI